MKGISTRAEEINSKSGEITFYGSVFNKIDSQNEIVQSTAFDKTITEFQKSPGESRLKFLLDHDQKKLLGVITNLSKDTHGLLVKAKFNLDKQLSREAFSDVLLYEKEGKSLEFSIGFRPVRVEMKAGYKLVHSVNLYEVSLIQFLASNEYCRVVNTKTIKPNKSFLL